MASTKDYLMNVARSLLPQKIVSILGGRWMASFLFLPRK